MPNHIWAFVGRLNTGEEVQQCQYKRCNKFKLLSRKGEIVYTYSQFATSFMSVDFGHDGHTYVRTPPIMDFGKKTYKEGVTL